MAHILIVEDDADQLEIRAMLLEGDGHQVSAASNAADARASAWESPPDAVVMDLRLPRLEDGIELIRSLRATRPGLFIAVLSGAVADFEHKPERKLVNAVFKKPARTGLLLETLRRLDNGASDGG